MSHQGYQHLSAKDVVFVEGLESSASLFKGEATLRVKDLLDKIKAICAASGQLSAEEVAILFGDGVNCEILRPGANDWQSGSLQMNLGFQSKGAGKPEMVAAPSQPATDTKQAVQAPATTGTNQPSRPTANPISPPPVAKLNTSNSPTPAKQAEPEIELNLDNFANANESETTGTPLEVNGIDSEDVFSLMDNTDVESIDSNFSFEESLGEIEELHLEAAAVSSEPIASPWDIEELDNMLMVK